MSATINSNLNPLKSKDRVKVSNKDHFLFGKKGTVKVVEGVSTYVLLDDKIEIITSFKNLKKLKKK